MPVPSSVPTSGIKLTDVDKDSFAVLVRIESAMGNYVSLTSAHKEVLAACQNPFRRGDGVLDSVVEFLATPAVAAHLLARLEYVHVQDSYHNYDSPAPPLHYTEDIQHLGSVNGSFATNGTAVTSSPSKTTDADTDVPPDDIGSSTGELGRNRSDGKMGAGEGGAGGRGDGGGGGGVIDIVTVTVTDGWCFYYDETLLTGCPRQPLSLNASATATAAPPPVFAAAVSLTIEVAPYGKMIDIVERHQESWHRSLLRSVPIAIAATFLSVRKRRERSRVLLIDLI